MNTLFQDIRYGLRTLGENPGFAAIAILTLALGIGANTALFSVVNGVLLNPLPFPNPDQLYELYSKTPVDEHSSISYLNFLDWRKDNHSFSTLGAFRASDMNLTGAGEPERLHGHMISAELFPTLDIPPILGRNFRPEEDQTGSAPVAIISDGLWKRKFGLSPDVINKTIALNGRAYTIVGVFPGRLPIFSASDVYTPVGQWDDPTFRDRRVGMGMFAIGRLKPEVSASQVGADMQSVAENLAVAYPDVDKGTGVTIVPLKTDVVGDVRGILLVLLGAVTFVLLIACANVANLLLARSTGRAREFAIRSALGAGPARVIRQLLTESVLLGIAGGAVGLLLAVWGTRAILAALPDVLPRTDEINMNWHVLLFTAAMSLLTGIFFGLAPALKALRADMHETLKEGGRGSSGSRHRTQSIFVVVEVAMALVLLVGAGLMIRSLIALTKINPGFDARNVLSFETSITSDKDVTSAQLRAKYRESVRQIESVAGVESAALVGGSIPMTGDSELPFWLDGQPKPANQNDMPFTIFYLVTPSYPSTMRIPVQRGRFFNDRDDEHAPAVVVIDSSFARKYFPNENPVGKHLNIGLVDMQPEIVGVVGHVEHWGLGARGHESLQVQLYMPAWQLPDKFWSLFANGAGYVVRTSSAPLGVVDSIRRAVGNADNTAAIYGISSMRDIVSNSISTQRLTMLLLGVFAALALTLSAVGIYGVISYLTGQRIHEIGVRMALGASRKDVLRMVLGGGMRTTLIGVGFGIAAAIGLTRLIAQLIYGVGATDPMTFAGVAALLIGVALLACYIPARRAMRVDPIIALRYE
jgi:putative ABC transport system permease protein